MQQFIFIQQNYRKLLLSGKQELFCVSEPLPVYKEALQKQRFLSMKNSFIFHLGFMLEKIILIKWWKSTINRTRCDYDDRYSRCWRVRQYLLKISSWQSPIISFDSISRLDIEPILTSIAVELEAWICRTIAKSSKITKRKNRLLPSGDWPYHYETGVFMSTFTAI